MVNYYDLLGVGQSATEEEIKAKLKMKKRVWTQRQNAPRPEQQQEASNNLRLVPKIEETLLDAQKRTAYDQQLRTAPAEESHVDASSIDGENLIIEGWNLLGKGNVPDALMVATKATETMGDNPDAWALLGYCKAQWGETDDAIYEYKRAIKLRPNDASFYFDLGGIYEGIENWSDALQQYERAEKIDPGTTVYRAAKGSVFIKNDMYQEGIGVLENCLQEEPDNEDYKELLVIAYLDSSWQNWTHIDDGEVADVEPGWYATSKAHVEEAERLIKKAERLNVTDQSLLQGIREAKQDIGRMSERKFSGFLIADLIWLAFGLFILFVAGDAFGLLVIAFSILYYLASRAPGYKRNHKILSTTKAAEVSQSFLDRVPGAGFIVILTLPLIAVWSGYKNYIAE